MEEGRTSKGKQKIEIKRIEDEKSRYITFTKRKSGIHKKACDIITLCGAKVDVLMFSPTGKPYCFGDPFLQSKSRQGASTSVNEENPPIQGSLEIQEINMKHDELLDQVNVEKEREKELCGILKTMNGRGWWEANVEHLTSDQAKNIVVYFEEIEKKLINELSIKGIDIASHDGKSSGQTTGFDVNIKDYGIGTSKNQYPGSFVIEQASGANSNPTYAYGNSNFGSNNNAYGFGASENNYEFGFAPIDQTDGDLFDLVFAHNKVCGDNHDNLFSDGNGSHGLNLSPSYGYEEGNPFITDGSKKNADTDGSEALFTSSPANQYQEATAFLFDDDFTFPSIKNA